MLTIVMLSIIRVLLVTLAVVVVAKIIGRLTRPADPFRKIKLERANALYSFQHDRLPDDPETVEGRLESLEFKAGAWTADQVRRFTYEATVCHQRIVVTGRPMVLVADVVNIASTEEEIAGEIRTTSHGKAFTFGVRFEENFGFWRTVERFQPI